MMDLAVTVEAPGWRALDPEIETRLAPAVDAALAAAGPASRPVELGVVLADDARVRELNRAYRGQDKPTNVLSFAFQDAPAPGDEAPDRPLPLGDVVVAYETLQREAEAEGKPPLDHLTHLVVHGVLHLLGYDHQTDADAEVMERLEGRILAGLGIADPYAGAPSAAVIERE